MRLAVSCALLFHLGGVLLMPNPASYLTQALSPVYRPYMNYLGLAHTFGFFAPEPVAPPMYIDYIIDKKGGQQISGRFPDEKDPFFFRDRQNRRMSLSRFIMNSDDNIRNMFVRYHCIHEKDLESIRLWRVTLTQPSLDDVKQGKKRMTDPADYKIEVLGTYYCPEKLE
jgi:hypothetical protein